jgi:hypothetical protein
MLPLNGVLQCKCLSVNEDCQVSPQPRQFDWYKYDLTGWHVFRTHKTDKKEGVQGVGFGAWAVCVFQEQDLAAGI